MKQHTDLSEKSTWPFLRLTSGQIMYEHRVLTADKQPLLCLWLRKFSTHLNINHKELCLLHILVNLDLTQASLHVLNVLDIAVDLWSTKALHTDSHVLF